MKLYVVSYGFEYEGGAIIGIFDSKDKAEKTLEKFEGWSDYKEINDINLNEDVEIWI